jgi:uncharacterized protein (DUF4415 family)
MAGKDLKIDAKDVIEKALSAKEKKRNITYRIDEDLLERFKRALKDKEVSGNQIVETLIRNFVESAEQKKK